MFHLFILFKHHRIDGITACLTLAIPLQIKPPPMPWTDQVAIFFNPPFAEIPTLMRTELINRVAATSCFNNNPCFHMFQFL